MEAQLGVRSRRTSSFFPVVFRLITAPSFCPKIGARTPRPFSTCVAAEFWFSL